MEDGRDLDRWIVTELNVPSRHQENERKTMGIFSDLFEAAIAGAGTAAGVVGKVVAQGAVEGAKIGYELGKATGDVAKETATGAAVGASAGATIFVNSVGCSFDRLQSWNQTFPRMSSGHRREKDGTNMVLDAAHLGMRGR